MTTNPQAPFGVSRVLSVLREIERVSHVDHAGVLVSAVLAVWGPSALAPEVRLALPDHMHAGLVERAQHARLVGACGQSGTRTLLVYRHGCQDPTGFSAVDVARICGSFWPAQYFIHLS